MTAPLYRIVITRVVANPHYDAAKEREKETRRMLYNSGEIYVPSTIDEKALTVDLTEAEFQAVKKAVLECM